MEDKIKLANLPIVKPSSCPPNVKCEDSLLNKVNMTYGDCALLSKVLSHYQEDYDNV